MRGPKLLVAAIVVVTGLLTLAGPAGAHTSVRRSEPADRTISDQPPETLTLEFVNRVDPRSVSVEVKAVDGTTVGAARRVTPDEPSTSTLVFELPALDDGTYGLAWQAVGDDGHVARGETVVGVGDPTDTRLAAEVGDATFSSGDGLGRLLELGAGVARSAWYVGLSLVVGAAYVLWWGRRSTRSRSSPTAGTLASSAAWWASTGWIVALAAAVGGAVFVIVARIRYVDDGSALDRALDSLRSGPAFAWTVAALAVLVAGSPLRRLSAGQEAAPGDGEDATARADVGKLVVLGLVAALASVQAGHAAVSAAPVIDLVALTAHLVAATIWVGPLAVVSLTALTPSWRGGGPAERRSVLTRFWSGYANLAFGAFVVLALSGAYSAWVTLDGRWFENTYGWVLAGKVALIVAVVVPLALYHDRVVRADQRAASPADGEARTADDAGAAPAADASSPGFLRSVRIEAVALVLVLGLAALLGGLDPGADTADAEQVATGAALFDDAPATDVATCAALEVGKRGCYRDYFRSVMEAEGADVAVDEIAALSTTDPFVARDCHQITHDLGADAVDFYGDLGKTLSFEASACWSGYYHGAVETELSQVDDAELLDLVPSVCADAARERYSFTHYNCVHGVGHGLMLRFDADLWTVIPYCEAYDAAEQWERRSCIGGAFMQNVVSAQEGEPATLKEDDLLYPCTELEGVYREECLGMQTSWALYKLDYDYAAGFALCDALDAASAVPCYKSMGRDISGGSLKDVGKVVAGCDLGSEVYREHCIVGAALDAVYDDHDTVRATELCERVDERWRAACLHARDSAASTF